MSTVPKTEVRNQLAIDRTHLANDRTMLAFTRTALYMVVTGLALINFYPESTNVEWSSYVLFAMGALIITLGLIRYFRMRRKINRHSL